LRTAPRRPRIVLTLLIPLLGLGLCLLSGCGSTAVAGSGATSSSSGQTPGTGTLDDVTVTGAPGAKPAVDFAVPFSVASTARKILTQGDGPEVTQGERVTVEYLGINGTDGSEFDTSFGKQAASFILQSDAVIKGFATGLTGVTVGSRVLLAIPPDDGYGLQGAPAAKIGPTDTLVFVIDVLDAKKPLARAEGTAVAPKAGLPSVTLDGDGKPTLTLPAGDPPKALVVQPLITGAGAKVAAGQKVTLHYVGVIWPGGKKFDSSWDRGTPAIFPIGSGKVIVGMDEGLVGQTIGSQILLVIPPDKGYGAAGNPAAGIKGTDTLVFVVDILDASVG
jgi:peptidylprolyl isomerase